MDLSPLAFQVIVAAVGLLLYAFLWWVMGNLPRVAKYTARVMLALVLIAPLSLAVYYGVQRNFASRSPVMAGAPPPSPQAPDQSQAERTAAPQPSGSAQPPAPARPVAVTAAPPPVAVTAPPPPVALPPLPPVVAAAPSAPAAEPTPLSVPPTAGSAPGGAPPSPTALGSSAPQPPDEADADGTTAPRTRSARPGPFASDNAAWDVVPVFYGTDRQAVPNATRIEYGSDRARKLQLGETLVTVPKSHEVPQVERPWVYRLPFTQIELYREAEDPTKHFTLKDIKELSKEAFLELVRKRLGDSEDYKDHALVFVHGFNTSFDNAIYRTAQIAYDLKFDGAAFVYSWPSKGQLGLSDYSYDRESAGQAEQYLNQFLQMVAQETGAKSVSVIAHSMGNQVLLPVLRDLRRSPPPGVEISQVILAAPDVDRDNFLFLASEIQGVSKGVTMFAAANDRALEASKRFWGGIPRAGDVPGGVPLIAPGVDTIDVTGINTDLLSLNHSGFAEKSALLSDIQLLIQTGERPPELRVPILQRIDGTGGVFWRYPATR